ncbi:hypothetical protein NXS97_18925 [Pantoea sp. B623]|uniref:hypothetical protein n=1 Tax=Pantoea sp. B623 TaxID=2974561 RepID=UPI0021696489|nr:hypothetical protein [Pantoea sp. B623]MCS4496225.1 hypothetical protein [Pantoea sp. B623]
MTAKELIYAFLKERGSARSVDIHAHLEKQGLRRDSSMCALSKLYKAGIVFRHQHGRDFICWLRDASQDFEISEINRRLSNANRRLTPCNSVNIIFDECRKTSHIYQMDQLLREARELR